MLRHPQLRLLLGSRVRRLVAPGALRRPLALIRAQAGGARATFLGADGVTWGEAGADVPRFHGPARRLLIGGQRTNGVRNPRAEGSPPTHWSVVPQGGLATAFIGSSVVGGINVATYEVTGTPSSTQGTIVNFDASIAAAVSEVWTGSAFVGLDPAFSNTTTGVSFGLRLLSATDATGTVFTPTTAPLSSQRVSFTRTMDVGTTTVQLRVRYAGSVGVPVSFRILIGWPQVEMAPFASTPILPAVNAPDASTRGSDLVSASLASLGIAANGACTILGTFLLPQDAPSGTQQMLLQMDDGGNNNRFLLRNSAGSGLLQHFAVVGASQTGSGTPGSMVAGVPFAIGMAFDGAGRIATTLNGAAVVIISSGPTSGLTTLRVGVSAGGISPLFGEVGALLVLPITLSDADLQLRVAALPL